jgi:hypothetical protein
VENLYSEISSAFMATLLKSTPTGQQLWSIKMCLLFSGGNNVSVVSFPFGHGKKIFLSLTS